MAKKKKVARGGGTAPPKKSAAKKKPKAKTGDEKPLVQKGIGDVLEPRDDELEEAFSRLANAKAAHTISKDERLAAYDELKKLMREKHVTNYRLHDEPSKRLVFKSRDAEVKIENIKKPKKSETAIDEDDD